MYMAWQWNRDSESEAAYKWITAPIVYLAIHLIFLQMPGITESIL